MQAVTGQLEVMRLSRPIARVIADPGTSAVVRARLVLAQRGREFAIRELGLPDGRSFRDYAELDREYVVWNVVATPEFSVEPRRWCFPVAGCVAYRGYFDERRARDLSRRLAWRGDDATVEGAATYSTLGHLPDPVFSGMLRWSEARLVGTIFHELAHERLYVPGDSSFSEAFANVVEQAGVHRWFAARGEARLLADYEASMRRSGDFSALLREARGWLEDLYADDLPVSQMRIEKEREFGRLKFRYQQLRQAWGGYGGYDAWFARTLNNAHLASVATYHDCGPGLERELVAAGSLPAFYARAEALAKLPAAARHAAVCGGK
jgi:predicted aminopeptidase